MYIGGSGRRNVVRRGDRLVGSTKLRRHLFIELIQQLHASSVSLV